MLENGLLEEAEAFYKNYPSQTAVNAIGYKELKPFIDSEKSLEECVESLKQATRKYAKRQLTWFNRNEKINWFYKDLYNDADEFYKSIDTIINKFLKGE
jgi:tRNA dimethylallyltransferase